MTMLRVRPATAEDADAIARIYNQGIEERIATYDTNLRTADEIAAQIREKSPRYPTIVVERAGTVVAWAWAKPYSTRACYAGIVDHSVYVAREARGIGAGTLALDGLIRACVDEGCWKITSRIFPENTASLALHERVGFRVVGTYERHAKVDGVWRDSVIVEKLIGEAATAGEKP
ncbi:MAG: arsinothricin resistance N-acetyltransferase ArsN1 family A [Alphaproteobacteria bacterium]